MCPTLMKAVTHDGSFLWIFGSDIRAIGRLYWVMTLKVTAPKKTMCQTLMKGVAHDGSFLWIFGPDTRAIGRFYWMLYSYVP